MANSLTGDFDIVAEVGVPAVNRLLAAEHQSKTFLHSFSTRIDDTPSILHYVNQPAEPSDPPWLRRLAQVWARVTTNTVERVAPCRSAGVLRHRGAYTGVRGFADVQVSTPTITIPADAGGTRVAVHYQVMARFTSDPGTPAMPEFIHGELQLTVDINQISSQVANVLEVDLSSDNIDVNFNVAWAMPPLTSTQGDLINRVIVNTLRRRFQPVNATLPQGIQQIQFKAMPAPVNPAAAVLLDMRTDAPPNPDPGGVSQIFLADGDDFAIALGRDYVVSVVHGIITNALSTAKLNFHFDFLFWTIYYTLQVKNVNIDLQPGQIVLSMDIHAHTDQNFPDEDLTVIQAVTLLVLNGAVVLVPLGNPQVQIGGIAALLRDQIVSVVLSQRSQVLDPAQAALQNALDSNHNLGALLSALKITAQLTYTAIGITPDGVVLHGTLSLNPWQLPHVEFTSNTILQADGSGQVELNALNTWIPGGTIQKYTWTITGDPLAQPMVITDQHRFVTSISTDFTSGSTNYCLEVQGTRITASGPEVEQTVNRHRCSINWVIFQPVAGYPYNPIIDRLPIVVLGPAVDHSPEIIAHIDPWSAGSRANTSSNIVVQFTNRESASKLHVLAKALAEGPQRDSAVSVIVVVPPGDLAHVKPISLGSNKSLNFAEDYEGGWGRVFGVEKPSATVVVSPQGQIVWRHTGDPDHATLSKALTENLSPGGRLTSQQLNPIVQQGAPAPDFLFEYVQDRCIPLRRFAGREMVLAFWTSWSQPSLKQLQYLQTLQGQRTGQSPIVLAINDGENPAHARSVFKENKFTSVLVPDDNRQISRSYGICCWPTTVTIDTMGVVSHVQLGPTPTAPSCNSSSSE